MNKIGKGHEIPNHERRNKMIRKFVETFLSFLVIKEMQIRSPNIEKNMKCKYYHKWLVENIN